MLINRKQISIEYFENLVIKVDESDSIKAYIVKYFKEQELKYNPQHKSYGFKGHTIIKEIQYNSSIFSLSADSVECTSMIMCCWGGSEHVAGENCANTYLVIDCSGGGGSSGSGSSGSGGTGSGSSGGSGTGTSGGGGGGGNSDGETGDSSSSTTTVLTATVTPPPPDEKKCELFNKLKIDAPFKGIINALKSDVGLPYEQGVVLTNQVGGGYNAIVGTANSNNEYAVEFNIPAGTVIDIITHNHYTGGLSIFSPADLEQMYKIIKSTPMGVDMGNFVSILVNPNRETYAITITDRAKFIAYGDENFGTKTKFDKFDVLYALEKDNPILKGFGINNSHTPAENEKNFLKMLGKESGLKAHKATADLSQWNPLAVNTNDNVIAEPACN